MGGGAPPHESMGTTMLNPPPASKGRKGTDRWARISHKNAVTSLILGVFPQCSYKTQCAHVVCPWKHLNFQPHRVQRGSLMSSTQAFYITMVGLVAVMGSKLSCSSLKEMLSRVLKRVCHKKDADHVLSLNKTRGATITGNPLSLSSCPELVSMMIVQCCLCLFSNELVEILVQDQMWQQLCTSNHPKSAGH